MNDQLITVFGLLGAGVVLAWILVQGVKLVMREETRRQRGGRK